MAKVNDRTIYPNVDFPSLLDFLLGTKEVNGKTRSFPLQSVIQLINGVNGKNNIQFEFSDGTNPDLDYLSEGNFFTNTNATEVGAFTQLIFNKNTVFPIDISQLFTKLGELQNVVIKLENPEDPNNFFNFKIVSFADHTDYFIFGVEDFNEFYLGELINEQIYSLYFTVNADMPEDFSKIVYFNDVNPSTATIFDLNNPPVTNDNSLKADDGNLYIGTDASTWVYKTSIAAYETKTITSSSSNFFLSGTSTDAGGNKTANIERTGSVGVGTATASNHAMRKDQVEAADTNILNQAKAYAELLTAGLLDLRGTYNASSNLFPATGGSGASGAILKGDFWYVSTGGTLAGKAVTAGDSFFAVVDAPGQTAGNWNVIETNIGYVPENLANKTDDIEANKTSSSFYASAKSVVTWILNFLFSNAPAKASSLVDADLILAGDSTDSFKTKTRTFAQLKSTIRTSLDTEISYACSDEITPLTVGTLITFRSPFGMILTNIKLSLNTAPTVSKVIVDIKKGGVSIFSTLISVNTGSTTSVGASIPAIISDPNLTDDSIITISTTQVGSGDAGTGLKVTFLGRRT